MKQSYSRCLLAISILISSAAANSILAQNFTPRDNAVAAPPDGHGAGTLNIGGIPVNLYTGAASPVIPICELPGRSLSASVSLAYTAGNGVQVTSVASEVGTGWALNAGGSIVCEVKGKADEIETNPKTWLNTLYNRTAEPDMTTAQQNICAGNDTEYDIYHLSAMGLQADFVITGTQAQPDVRVLNNQTLTIAPGYAGRYINSFTITDAYGTRYLFMSDDQTRVQTETKLVRNGTVSAKEDYTYTSAWHLRSIDDTKGDRINLNYSAAASSNVVYKSFSHETYAYTNCDAYGQNCTAYTIAANLENRYETTTTVSTFAPYKISSISSAAGRIEFSRGLQNRRDAPGENSLDKISIFDPYNRLISTYLFTYGYFGASSGTTRDDVRLRLDKITQKNAGCWANSTAFQY